MKTRVEWTSKTKGLPRTGYYEDCDNFSNLPAEKIKAISAFCYTDGQFVLVQNEGRWEPVVGHVEPYETFEQALLREIKEESNMEVLSFFPLGYLYINEVDIYQAQYLCVTRPYGPFLSDPDGGVTAIKLVPQEEIVQNLDPDDTASLTLKRCAEVLAQLKVIDKIQ